jgi:3,4-dihydroxy 2-butanone 4-phosphate synthase
VSQTGEFVRLTAKNDLIFSTENLNPQQMALLIREYCGIVCLCLTPEKAAALHLTPMVEKNTSPYGTAFTISIEAAEGVTTGVSASDRVKTVKATAAENANPQDLRHPGHVFPLVAKAGGVLERPGHTEATVDMMKLADLSPERRFVRTNQSRRQHGRLSEIKIFATKHFFPVVSVKDIIEYRKAVEA